MNDPRRAGGATCPAWCDRSHETRAEAGDRVHTTEEYVFEGRLPGPEIAYVMAERSSDNGDVPGFVSVSGVKLPPADARRLALRILELAEIVEDQ